MTEPTRDINMTRRHNIGLAKALITAVTAFLFVVMSNAAAASATLSKIRIGQTQEKTRVVFDIKHNHYFKIARLDNPPRVVVDFYKAKNKVSFKQKKILDSRLEKIRVKNQKNRTRIVLDLRKDYDHNYFVLGKNKSGAERVVIDLTNRMYVKKKTVKPAKKQLAKASKPKQTKRVKHTAKMTDAQMVKHGLKVAAKTSDVSRHKTTQKKMDEGSVKFKTKTKELVVAIDPGHGGKDTGAIGPRRTQEKIIVLQMAKKLKRYIDAQPGMRAILTRDKDVFIPLHKRVRYAHRKDADIFLSLHADAFPDKSVSGGSVYVLSTRGASSVMARILAKSENASLHDIKLKGRDADVAFVLSDLTREANIRASRKLARAVLGEMGRSVKLHKSTVQSANFAVLKSIDIPSLLIETAFISNPNEARKLRSSQFQTKLAKSIVRGLKTFVKENADEPRWGETLYVHYKVQKGDTLSEIAANYNISTKLLKKLNKIKHANHLYVGKKLRIPVSEKIIATL